MQLNADLADLHDLFCQFVEKLKSNPPAREMKLRLIQDVAQEFSVTWDPKSLEQQLQSSSTTAQVEMHVLFSSQC